MADVSKRELHTMNQLFCKLVLTAVVFVSTVATATDKPNIVFILTDDQDVTMGGQVCTQGSSMWLG